MTATPALSASGSKKRRAGRAAGWIVRSEETRVRDLSCSTPEFLACPSIVCPPTTTQTDPFALASTDVDADLDDLRPGTSWHTDARSSTCRSSSDEPGQGLRHRPLDQEEAHLPVVSDLVRTRLVWRQGSLSMDEFFEWLGPRKSKGIRMAVMTCGSRFEPRRPMFRRPASSSTSSRLRHLGDPWTAAQERVRAIGKAVSSRGVRAFEPRDLTLIAQAPARRTTARA